MTSGQMLAHALTRLFVEKNVGWFTPFPQAVGGLSATQAASVPRERFNSIWGVVNHVNFWQESVLQGLRGEPVDTEAMKRAQGWQLPTDPDDEASWQAACQQAVALNRVLSATVAALDDAALDAPFEVWNETRAEAVLGLIAHNSYHICEIVSLRHLRGWWLADG